MSELIPIVIVAATLLWGLVKKVDMPSAFACGVKRGLETVAAIFPNILIMMAAVSVFRAAGAVAVMSDLLAPVMKMTGIPPETAQILLLRPFSGSAALALGKEIMGEFGVDSEIGRIAGVMLGASETSIYTIGVYSGFIGMKKTGRLTLCALAADLAAFLAAVWCVRILG